MRKRNPAVAHHEAGHAIIAYYFRQPLGLTKIRGDESGISFSMSPNHEAREEYSPELWLRFAAEQARVHLAGPSAEHIFSGRLGNGSGADEERATWWLQYLEPNVTFAALFASTCELLKEERTWEAVSRVASHLMQKGSIRGSTVEVICRVLKVPRVALSRSAQYLHICERWSYFTKTCSLPYR
jgi:hypothetical protein